MDSNWIYRLERKFGRYAIRNLMTYTVAGMGIVFVLNEMSSAFIRGGLAQYLIFNRAAISRGEIWRLITFIFIPPNASMLFILFSLYFYWLIGNALQNYWGSFKFNLFYLCGMVGTMLSGLITGYATNSYLNLSLFFAFALLYPDFQMMLFFILPIKIKYLALLNATFFVLSFFQVTWAGKLALLVSLLNLALFFWKDLVNRIHQWRRRRAFKDAFKR